MPSLTQSKEINAKPEQVFSAINNYEHRLEWDTLLRKVEIVSEDGRVVPRSTPLTEGMRVRSFSRWTAGGVMMDTLYTHCAYPRAVIEMVEGPWFFKSFKALALLEETPNGGTRWNGEYVFECRPRCLRWLIEPIVSWMFLRETRRRVQGMKLWLEPQALEDIT